MGYGGILSLALLLGGCARESAPAVLGGNPDTGRDRIAAYGCGGCHEIPGVRGAHGTAGPPLGGFGRRSFIAGGAPNTILNLTQWLRAPQSLDPGTAMPALGVTEEDARHIAAYLYTLR